MCELLRRDFEGMHPTFRHVPPRAPRFSTHAVCVDSRHQRTRSPDVVSLRRKGSGSIHLQALLCSLDGRHIASGTATWVWSA